MFSKSVDNTRHVNGPALTLISRSTEIVGDIHFSGELIIEGKVKGNIYAEDDSEALIRVAENGSVEGEICVPSAIVNGLVQGDVRAAIHIELAAKAVVVGNVYYNFDRDGSGLRSEWESHAYRLESIPDRSPDR